MRAISLANEKVIAPVREFWRQNKAGTYTYKNKGGDHDQLLNEDGEIDELDLNTQPHLYNYDSRPASGTPAFQSKILHFAERCPCCRIKKRWLIALLANLGFLIIFGIRCNFGAARARMTRNFTNPHTKEVETATFDWSPSTLGILEGSFFYGYIVTQLPGGLLASRFPANKLFGIAVGGVAFLNLWMPSACKSGAPFVVAIQVLQGLVQGVAFPAMHGIWRYWAPPLERSKLATTAFVGTYAGAVIGLPLSATLTADVGWPSSFYVYGVAGVIWFFFWWLLTVEKPCNHPTISEEERIHIETSIGPVSTLQVKMNNVPWKSIFTSMPVYAIVAANFGRSWTFYLLLNSQLTYYKQVLGLEIDEGGWLAALPHLVMAIFVAVGGQLADFLRQRQILSTTNVRKIFNCGGFGGEALFLVVTAFTKNITGAIIALTIAVGCSGFAISGFNVNHLDIAPRYASLLMGISNGIGTLAGMICPVVTERLSKDYGKKGWETIFLLAGLIHFLAVTFYAIFASGEKQSWAEPPEETSQWKADDFAQKAVQSGKLATYGTSGYENNVPFSNAGQISGTHEDENGANYYDYGDQQYYAADYDSGARDSFGISNDTYRGH